MSKLRKKQQKKHQKIFVKKILLNLLIIIFLYHIFYYHKIEKMYQSNSEKNKPQAALKPIITDFF